MQFPRTGLVDVVQFGIWNAGLAFISVLCVASTAMWMVWSYPGLANWAALSAMLLVAFSLTCAWTERRRGPIRLRWAHGFWRMGFPGSAVEDPLTRVDVVVDLGAWMLLRCETEGHTVSRKVHWLPLQSDGLQGGWHSLRCALHSGQPPETSQLGERLSSQ